MEYLSFNSAGQWSLHKSSPEGGISTPRDYSEPGNDFKAYSNVSGQLHEDHGQKGSIHGAPGNKRAPKQGKSPRNWAKPATRLPSAAANTDPGLGV